MQMLLEIFAGVLSGAISAIVAIKVTNIYNLSFQVQFLIRALVASLTVGRKSTWKGICKAKKWKYSLDSFKNFKTIL